jgi:hypothetical protein
LIRSLPASENGVLPSCAAQHTRHVSVAAACCASARCCTLAAHHISDVEVSALLQQLLHHLRVLVCRRVVQCGAAILRVRGALQNTQSARRVASGAPRLVQLVQRDAAAEQDAQRVHLANGGGDVQRRVFVLQAV